VVTGISAASTGGVLVSLMYGSRKRNNDVLSFVETARELLPRVGSEVIRIRPAPFRAWMS